MRKDQILATRIRSESKHRLCTKLAFAALTLMVASAAYANDEAAASTWQLTLDTAPALDDSPQVANVAALLWRQFRVARQEATLIARAVFNAANQYAVSPVLLLAVIATESGFDRQAVSVAGAEGLMQILPTAHPQLVAASKDLREPAENVRIGSSILREYLDASGGGAQTLQRRRPGLCAACGASHASILG